ncbi:MAG: hypothetical protein IMZ43_12255 [Thermoplasmata archaeon]|nr:hypothetical protein [Thermoplasmata archaeon]
MKARIRKDLIGVGLSVPIKKIYPYLREFNSHGKSYLEAFQPGMLGHKEENLILLDSKCNIYLARSIDFEFK